MKYPGIDHDVFGGMTDLGRIIRDAWVLGVLPETETGEGWERPQFDDLYAKVHAAWEPYGHLVGRLPPELRARHQRIYDEAIRKARALGWSPELDDEDE
mgnify:CR=1 FL=1